MPKTRQKSRRLGKGSSTVQQKYSTTVFHTYIPYNNLKHYKKDKKDNISKIFGMD